MPSMKTATLRRLHDLRGIGPRMLDDFNRLGIRSVPELARRNPLELYRALCNLTGERQDPCVYDTFRCAIAQARNPDLPPAQRNWWYWSAVRKSEDVQL